MYQSREVYKSPFEVKAHAPASEDVGHSGIKRDTKARTFIASIPHFRNSILDYGSCSETTAGDWYELGIIGSFG